MKFLKKNSIYLILLVLLAIYAFVPSVKSYINEQFFPIATIEKSITIEESDYDVDLKGINTNNANLKDFYGKKLVFLNFWGTWCPPCIKEWPSIQELYNAKKDNVDFVLIAMQDEEEKVRKFLEENNYTVPVYIAESPLNERILPKVFPTTFLLDKEGRILLQEDASKNWNEKSVLEFIDNVSP